MLKATTSLFWGNDLRLVKTYQALATLSQEMNKETDANRYLNLAKEIYAEKLGNENAPIASKATEESKGKEKEKIAQSDKKEPAIVEETKSTTVSPNEHSGETEEEFEEMEEEKGKDKIHNKSEDRADDNSIISANDLKEKLANLFELFEYKQNQRNQLQFYLYIAMVAQQANSEEADEEKEKEDDGTEESGIEINEQQFMLMLQLRHCEAELNFYLTKLLLIPMSRAMIMPMPFTRQRFLVMLLF